MKRNVNQKLKDCVLRRKNRSASGYSRRSATLKLGKKPEFWNSNAKRQNKHCWRSKQKRQNVKSSTSDKNNKGKNKRSSPKSRDSSRKHQQQSNCESSKKRPSDSVLRKKRLRLKN